ncbi:MAG: hypothetical protein CMJ40_06405 [Phycisphaerae bacterium]|nr:hypothetical protein [Phycisphaerae bacterium]
MKSPLRSAPHRQLTNRGPIHPNATPLELNVDAISEFKSRRIGDQFQIERLLVEPGLSLDLDVKRVQIFTRDATIVVMDDDGKGGVKERQLPSFNGEILVGRVVGDPDSKVVLGLSDQDCNGYILSKYGTHLLASAPDGKGPVLVYPVGDQGGEVPLALKPFTVLTERSGPPVLPEQLKNFMAQREELSNGRSSTLDRSGDSRRDRNHATRSGGGGSGACCMVNFDNIPEGNGTGTDQYGRYGFWKDCDVMSQEDCQASAGIFYPDLTCNDLDNPETPEDGCQDTHAPNGGNQGVDEDGNYLGQGDDVPGACCLNESLISEDSPYFGESCLDIGLKACEELNGIFYGAFSNCGEDGGICGTGPLDCSVVTVGIDTDSEFLTLFQGNTTKAINYIALLAAASSEIFADQIGVNFQLTQLRLWATGIDPWTDDDFTTILQGQSDPYGQGSLQAMLDTLSLLWLQQPPCPSCPLPDIVHLLSGRSIGYGRAAGPLCGFTDIPARAVTASIQGGFPYPLADFRPENWDLINYTRVTAQTCGGEIETSTDQYSTNTNIPVFIDDCAVPSDAQCIFPEDFPPSIMSKCYECPGGVSNISLNFHPYVRGVLLRNFQNYPCGPFISELTALDDVAFAVPGLPVYVDAQQNDFAHDCENLEEDDSVTILGKTIFGSTLGDWPKITPLQGNATTNFLPGNLDVEYRRIIYRSPCDLFEGTICPIGNAYHDWPLNPQSPNYVDTFGYMSVMQSEEFDGDPDEEKRDEAVVRMVISPPPQNWPSACVAGINCNASDGTSFAMNLNVTMPAPSLLDPQPEANILSLSFLNLVAVDTATQLEVSPSEACFEILIENANGTIEPFQYDWDGDPDTPQDSLICPFGSGLSSPFITGDSCGGWTFLNPLDLDPLFKTKTGGLLLRLVWNGDVPADPIRWLDGRIYLQTDVSSLTYDWQAAGACCLGDTCLELEPVEDYPVPSAYCEVLGGEFRGVGTNCDLSDLENGLFQSICSPSVPLSLGACCVPDQVGAEQSQCECTITTEPSCIQAGGVFFEWDQGSGLGYNQLCFAQTCNAQETTTTFCNNNATVEGACCVTDPFGNANCLIATQNVCSSIGIWQGEGIPCLDIVCPEDSVLTGACCLGAGCIPRTREQCEGIDNAIFWGEGSDCSICSPLPGSCCLGDYCMKDVTQVDCISLEGIYRAPDADEPDDPDPCTSTPCEYGACCFGAICVDDISVAECLDTFDPLTGIQGTPLGVGETCGFNACTADVDIGTCCVEQVCYQITEIECLNRAGNWLGLGGSCEGGICLQGACCLGQFCLVGDREACEAITDPLSPPGFLGYGIYCEDPVVSCVGCPPDIDGSGTIDINDLLILLGQFGANGGQADVNNDGIVDVLDVLEILANWSEDC